MTTPYTKTPNAIIDAMPDMSEAELKLTMALVRATYGYHIKEVRMTYDDMEEATGLSRPAVSRAIDAVVERGFFKRGRRSMWCINSNKLLLNEVNYSNNSLPKEEENSNNSELNEDTNSNKLLPYYSNNLLPSSSYKEKEEKENIYIAPDTDEVAELKTAVASVAREPIWEKTQESYDQFAHILLGWKQTPNQVKGFAKWWAVNKPPEYVGKPALTSVINRYQDYMAGVVVNGNGSTPTGKPKKLADKAHEGIEW